VKWHYTIRDRLEMIVRSGVILPATAYVDKSEKPIVWFSTNPWWEETANKWLADPDGSIRALDMMETHAFGGGLVRIGVAPETAPHDWQALKNLSGMHSKTAAGLYSIAVGRGARPGEWWGTFDPVPQDDWIALEFFDGSRWNPVEELLDRLDLLDGKVSA
jgi:hypothetical protein